MKPCRGFEVKIIKDSISKTGARITTYQLKYPRIIHSEVLTHRVFSRNASSSRAIPLNTNIEELKKSIYIPYFQKNKPGMQGSEYLNDQEQFEAEVHWKLTFETIINKVQLLNKVTPQGIHKQFINRLLEPFSFISVVLTATDFSNFFELRFHEAAQPEIYHLAKLMKEAYDTSTPSLLEDNQWHLPYITEEDTKKYTEQELFYKSVACCARVSYNNHDNSETTIESCKTLYDRLLSSKPIHASPAEHQAQPLHDKYERSGNFQGWLQYRKVIENKGIK